MTSKSLDAPVPREIKYEAEKLHLDYLQKGCFALPPQLGVPPRFRRELDETGSFLLEEERGRIFKVVCQAALEALRDEGRYEDAIEFAQTTIDPEYDPAKAPATTRKDRLPGTPEGCTHDLLIKLMAIARRGIQLDVENGVKRTVRTPTDSTEMKPKPITTEQAKRFICAYAQAYGRAEELEAILKEFDERFAGQDIISAEAVNAFRLGKNLCGPVSTQMTGTYARR